MRQRPSFASVGNILEQLFHKDHTLKKKAKQYAIFNDWKNIVGENIANQTKPLRWQNQTLIVAVSDSCWLHQLRMMEREVIQKIIQSTSIPITKIQWVSK